MSNSTVITMRPRFTVCTECEHFLNLDSGSCRESIWYNHLCKASPLPKRRDPYDGIEKPWQTNDIGGGGVAEHEFHFCRNANDGSCRKWEPLGDG